MHTAGNQVVFEPSCSLALDLVEGNQEDTIEPHVYSIVC